MLVNFEGYSKRKAAIEVGINPRTACDYYNRYIADEKGQTMGKKIETRGRKPTLKQVHTNHLVDYVEKNPAAILENIKDDLCAAFEGLTIGKTALHNHLKEKCGLTLKKLEKQPEGYWI
ncbi:hypothetical protein DFQ28_004934 [Apophysomyces sp. BC1034]|nr:hypothetical protein DFQ28_004934 [Apophysomyces sp. BC1034]